MHTALKYFQLVISIFLILAIVIQKRGAGLSESMGGSGTIYTTKRGAEKVVFNATVILAVLFVLSALAFLFVS